MKSTTIKDIVKLVLVSTALYFTDTQIISNYLSSPAHAQYLMDSPYRILAVFLMGVILYVLLIGCPTLKKFYGLCIGAFLCTAVLILFKLLLVQAAHIFSDVSRIGGLTWSYVLAFSLPMFLYSILFGMLLRALKKDRRKSLEWSGILWRSAWFVFCLLAAALYQKSIDYVPHTRWMDYQPQLSSLIFLFVPILGVFLDILHFRAQK